MCGGDAALYKITVTTCYNSNYVITIQLFAFSALTFLVGCQEEHPVCKKLTDEVLAWLPVESKVQIICKMVQLMPLPHIISCSIKIHTFNLSDAGLPRLSWK